MVVHTYSVEMVQIFLAIMLHLPLELLNVDETHIHVQVEYVVTHVYPVIFRYKQQPAVWLLEWDKNKIIMNTIRWLN